ncbi:MAG: hypothetical protein KC431_23215 [Myxococcales bacterium]|nr:hypothetical protein [Myxococcales bacterium]MCA9700456.1 hypothetical protein [Myxococcales bacterium]
MTDLAAARVTLALTLVFASVGGLSGCRADDEQCRELARHVSELAGAEGKGGPGVAQALEGDCQQLRPTEPVVQCMLKAQTLADLDAC